MNIPVDRAMDHVTRGVGMRLTLEMLIFMRWSLATDVFL